MARPRSTEQAIGAPASEPRAVNIIREVEGFLRYWSLSGRCTDRMSIVSQIYRRTGGGGVLRPQGSCAVLGGRVAQLLRKSDFEVRALLQVNAIHESHLT